MEGVDDPHSNGGLEMPLLTETGIPIEAGEVMDYSIEEDPSAVHTQPVDLLASTVDLVSEGQQTIKGNGDFLKEFHDTFNDFAQTVTVIVPNLTWYS